MIGCSSFANNNFGSAVDLSADNITNKCREYCHFARKHFSVVSDTQKCFCSDNDFDYTSVVESKCGEANNWKVFWSSGVSSSNSFELRIKVVPLQTRPYVKPGETVKLAIESNILAYTEYNVNFGDGTSIVTPEMDTSHSWKNAGTFTITIQTTVGEVTITNKTQFTIEDVDEGVKPEMVVMSNYHSTTQMTGEFEVEVFDNAETKCFVNFDDGSQAVELGPWSSYFGEKEFGHGYSVVGEYNVSTKCDNMYGTTSNVTTFVSKKFDIPFRYYSLADDFHVDIAGGRAFIDQLKVIRLSSSGSTEVNITRKNNGITINSKSVLPFENVFHIKSGDETIMAVIFHGQSLFGKAEITPSIRNSDWTMTTNVSIDVPIGNHLFINASLGIDDDRLLYVYEADVTETVTFEVEYPDLGYYPVSVTSSNDLMSNVVNDLMSVEVPISSIVLRTSNITDRTKPVQLYVTLNTGELGPDKVQFTIIRGDGTTDVVRYRSKTQNFTTFLDSYVYKDWGIYTICVKAENMISYNSSCILVQVGQNLTHVDIQTSTMTRVTTSDYAEFNITSDSGSDITYEIEFGDGETFEVKGVKLENGSIESFGYNAEDNSDLTDTGQSNSTSEDDDSTSVTGFFTSTLPTNVVSVIMDALSTSSSIDVAQSTDTAASRKRRDVIAKPISIATKLSGNIIRVKHMYRNEGLYHIQAKIQNAFTVRYAELCPSILVDNSDVSMCEEPSIELANRETTRANPFVNIRSKEFNITVNAHSNCGVGNGYEYSWKATKYYGHKERPITEICLDEDQSNVFVLPALFLEYGKYRITVTVAAYGKRLKSSAKSFYLQVVPSYPYAIIGGGEEVSFLVYGSVSFNLDQSRDPDLVTNNKRGIQFDMVCGQRDEFTPVLNDNLKTLTQKSSFIFNSTFSFDDVDTPFRLYEFGTCFKNVANASREMRLWSGVFSFPADVMMDTAADFTFKLFVTKSGRSNSTYQHIKIKLTNSSNVDDMLNALANIEDAAGMLRAISSIKGDILGGGVR